MAESDAQYLTNLLITLLSEDPTKIIEAMEDAEAMTAIGADLGASKHEMMAEYCLHAFKRQNPHLTDVIEVINLNQDEIESGLIAYFDTIGSV